MVNTSWGNRPPDRGEQEQKSWDGMFEYRKKASELQSGKERGAEGKQVPTRSQGLWLCRP